MHIKITYNHVNRQHKGKFNLLIPVLGLKKFLYKSATDRKRWPLRHHISLWRWLKRRKHNFTDQKYQLLIKDDPESVTNVLAFLYKLCFRFVWRCFSERYPLKEPEHSGQDLGHRTHLLTGSLTHPRLSTLPRQFFSRTLQSPSNSQSPALTSSRK